MKIIWMVLILLLAVTISGIVAQATRSKLPIPLIQIFSGAVLARFLHFTIALDPNIFFLLFIPPLLFFDGWRIPKAAFFRDLYLILTLSIGLVVFTVVGIGFLISWLIPTIPTATAFALAAILSPTDPVAVAALASGNPLPKRLAHILEGEALLNDASGLVCFRFAVVAAMTGHFSIVGATSNFVVVAGFGAAVGVAVAWTIGLINQWLVRQSGEEPSIQLLISMLIPFSAYLAAEHFRLSGILSAASAGIAMHYSDFYGQRSGSTRLQRNTVWDAFQMILNGSIFVLLGNQLPAILDDVGGLARPVSDTRVPTLIGYVCLITLAMTALRFLWVWVSLKLTLVINSSRLAIPVLPEMRILLLASFAGVRGAVTLAGILSLPLLMSDGTPFPFRDLSIALAMGVILLSMIVGMIAIPWLTKSPDLRSLETPTDAAQLARHAASRAALSLIEQIRESSPPNHPVAVQWVMDLYRRRLEQASNGETSKPTLDQAATATRSLGLQALKAERDTLYSLRVSGQIDDAVYDKLIREIDLIEAILSANDQ